MAKHRMKILMVIVSLLLICVIAYAYLYQGRQQEKSKKVSVIVHGDNVQRWENFQQGINQAAFDMNVEVTFLTMTDDVNSVEQQNLIEREIKNKAEGLIVAAVNSSEMTQPIHEAAKAVALVMAETEVYEGKGYIPYVSADNYKMGEELAKQIIDENDKNEPIYLIEVNQQRSSIKKRQSGLLELLDSHGYNVVLWSIEDTSNIKTYTAEQQKLVAPGVIVALDELALESVIDGTEERNDEFKIYGIGSTAKIVYYLDQGIVKGIVFQDEYNMGYTSMIRLMEQTSNRKDVPVVSGKIEVHSANKSTIHLPEEERLLYPIIQ